MVTVNAQIWMIGTTIEKLKATWKFYVENSRKEKNRREVLLYYSMI